MTECPVCEELFFHLSEYDPEIENFTCYNQTVRELKEHVSYVHSQLEEARIEVGYAGGIWVVGPYHKAPKI